VFLIGGSRSSDPTDHMSDCCEHSQIRSSSSNFVFGSATAAVIGITAMEKCVLHSVWYRSVAS
jgi:hypothetical protein